MTDLRFPNIKDEQEDPAIAIARKTLDSRARCWRCQKPVGKENLTIKWIKRLGQQRSLCEECIPLKDEPIDGDEEIKPVKRQRKQVEHKQEITHTATEKPASVEMAKFPPPIKECLNCDSNLFYLLRGGKIKCSGCGEIFKIGNSK